LLFKIDHSETKIYLAKIDVGISNPERIDSYILRGKKRRKIMCLKLSKKSGYKKSGFYWFGSY
jgi:hypothetical protein